MPLAALLLDEDQLSKDSARLFNCPKISKKGIPIALKGQVYLESQSRVSQDNLPQGFQKIVEFLGKELFRLIIYESYNIVDRNDKSLV